jgi:hypothetical protein
VDAERSAAKVSEHVVALVRQAEHEVERQAWDVHCIEHAAERAETEAAEQRRRAADAREILAVKQQALGAILAQFPDVVPEEVDLHGVA